ncbi:MAG: hypothetical protein B6241_05355 [Spirochaetaceae bacterium 4572_59]|nr:MAG: hypothetical protein B6241_05355 [Spirochaetaceae bacterium 4572_59]
MKYKSLYSVPGLFCLVLFSSCEWLDQLQNMEPPVLELVSPSEETIDPGSFKFVELSFSHEMDRKLSEEAFTLDEDDTALDGSFSWSGNTMSFTPYYGFTADREYRLSLKKSAEDKWGNSLKKDWYSVFFSGCDHKSPEFLSSLPPDYSVFTSLREPLILTFNEEMNPQSFRSSLRLSPDILMDQNWDERGQTITLTPLEDYELGQDYTLNLSTELCDLAGNPLLKMTKLYFPASSPIELTLDSLMVKTSSLVLKEESRGINAGLEKDAVLEGVLNIPADYDERNSLVDIVPSLAHELHWNADYTDFDLSFTELLSYGSYYDLSILDQCYILYVDGEGSRPICLSKLVFCPDATAASPIFTRLSLNSSLGASDSSSAFLDFYLELAPGASINMYDFMDALNIESSVLAWDYLSLEIYDGTQTPAPDPMPETGETLIRIHTEVNDYGLPGTVSFSLGKTLSDTLDNTLTENWFLTVSQP